MVEKAAKGHLSLTLVCDLAEGTVGPFTGTESVTRDRSALYI